MSVAVLAALTLTGCASGDGGAAATGATTTTSTPSASMSTAPADADEMFPDIEDVTIESQGDRAFRFDVTMSSPYDTPERYADAWRVVGPDGTVLGTRELAHDHAGEQPFTRGLDGVEIPEGVSEVTVEGRDQVSGYGGQTRSVTIPASS